MNRLRPSSTLAVIVNSAAIACFATGYVLPALMPPLIAYFAAIKKVPKYASWYQFITTFISVALLGFFIDLLFTSIPFVIAILIFAAAALLIRIMYFCKFTRAGYSWLEPLMPLLSAGLYVSVIL